MEILKEPFGRRNFLKKIAITTGVGLLAKQFLPAEATPANENNKFFPEKFSEIHLPPKQSPNFYQGVVSTDETTFLTNVEYDKFSPVNKIVIEKYNNQTAIVSSATFESPFNPKEIQLTEIDYVAPLDPNRLEMVISSVNPNKVPSEGSKEGYYYIQSEYAASKNLWLPTLSIPVIEKGVLPNGNQLELSRSTVCCVPLNDQQLAIIYKSGEFLGNTLISSKIALKVIAKQDPNHTTISEELVIDNQPLVGSSGSFPYAVSSIGSQQYLITFFSPEDTREYLAPGDQRIRARNIKLDLSDSQPKITVSIVISQQIIPGGTIITPDHRIVQIFNNNVLEVKNNRGDSWQRIAPIPNDLKGIYNPKIVPLKNRPLMLASAIPINTTKLEDQKVILIDPFSPSQNQTVGASSSNYHTNIWGNNLRIVINHQDRKQATLSTYKIPNLYTTYLPIAIQ